MPAPRSPSALYLGVLVTGMLVTGASNSLWSKFQDMQCVAFCSDPDVTKHKLFEQPTWQTLTMFLGETLCLVAGVFLSSRYNPFRVTARASASATARKAVLASQAARLASAPLSRPDESAFDFSNSAISLRNDESYDAEASGDVPEETQPMGWTQALPFWAPAICDICGTTAMNIGLLNVPVSVYQMLRGCLVLWVGVFSVIFLKRRLTLDKWAALATVMLGVAVVGLSSVVGGKKAVEKTVEEPSRDPTVGIFLIVTAQLFRFAAAASQFVLEEKIMEKHSVEALFAVGYEGSFGLGTTMAGMVVGHMLYGSTAAGHGGFFDASEGWREIVQNPAVWGSSVAIAFSIALFNFCGLAVTKSVSATARSTIDTSRTCLIWAVSLFLGWEHFKWLQVTGFALLVYGTFVFNDLVKFPEWTRLHPLDIPSITLSDEDEEEDEDDSFGRSRSVDAVGRPVTRRSGSGRRGEASPLLKTIVDE